MFWEFLVKVLELDISWLLSFVHGNLWWVFAFAACAYWYYPKKNIFIAIAVISIFLWSFVDVTLVSGWVYLVGGFLAFNYISRVAVLAFTESDEILRKYTVPIMVVQFYITWIIYNIFLV